MPLDCRNFETFKPETVKLTVGLETVPGMALQDDAFQGGN